MGSYSTLLPKLKKTQTEKQFQEKRAVEEQHNSSFVKNMVRSGKLQTEFKGLTSGQRERKSGQKFKKDENGPTNTETEKTFYMIRL
jgi:hypothetical protein